MTGFLDSDFLLDTRQARHLYHDVAAGLPIIDYHNHLPAGEIATDRHWDNLGALWLEHDHYKWRAMRWAGIDERFVTGDASDREKYDAFASITPRLIGNPLYHWTHLELWRYFGLDGEIFSPRTADLCWDAARERLSASDFGARGLLRRMKVEFIATTDDPLDTLEHHAALAAGPDDGLRVAPTFRPDKAFQIETDGFSDYIRRLADSSGGPIRTFDDLTSALVRRLDHFVAHGCRAADHGVDLLETGREMRASELNAILSRRLNGQPPEREDAASFRAALFTALGRAYCERNMVMQLHIGALRNNRSHLMAVFGTDAGADSIRDRPIAEPLNLLLDRLDRTGELPRTILYGLDPARNPVIVTTAGNFQDGGIAGKVQAGTAWWFNDQLDGMERQMTALSQMGLLSTFLGMLTDSRSFLSFPRHEYFRRLLSRMVGRWMADGLMPDDSGLAGGMIADISYRNARRWFVEPPS